MKRQNQDRDYYRKHSKNILKKRRRYYLDNRDRITAQRKINRQKPVAKKKQSAYAKKYRLKKGEQLKKYKRDWYYKTNARLRRYSLTPQEYDQLVISQNSLCLICGEHKPLVIDHCHSSKKVRGLLCDRCNYGLGCFQDNPKYLESARRYIEGYAA